MSPLRFFLVLLRPNASALFLATGILALGAYLARAYPEGVDQAVAIALFLQLFAASTGFRDRLRRGHFDPVLAGGSRRVAVAAAHWFVSIGPGLSVWLALGLINALSSRSAWPTPFTPAGLMVILYTSTMTWVISLPMGRYSGAVLWLVALFTLAATLQLQAMRQTFSAAADSWAGTLQSFAGVLVCPVFLLIDPLAAGPPLLALLFAATVGAWLAGVALITCFPGILVEA
jgi:hypothetical protein